MWLSHAILCDILCDPSLKMLLIAWGPEEGLTNNLKKIDNNHCNKAMAEQKCAQQYSVNEDARAHKGMKPNRMEHSVQKELFCFSSSISEGLAKHEKTAY